MTHTYTNTMIITIKCITFSPAVGCAVQPSLKMEQVSDVGRVRTRALPKAGGPTALNAKAPAVAHTQVLKYERRAIAKVVISAERGKQEKKN